MRPSRDRKAQDPILAFVGVLVPDDLRFHGPAFSRAGVMFQEGLLGGLASAGLQPDALFAVEPIPAMPRSARLFGRSGNFTLLTGLSVRLLPFLNIHPFKWFTTGAAVLFAIAGWSWKHRGKPRVVLSLNLTMPPGMFVWLSARLTGTRAVVAVLDVFKPGALVRDTWLRRLDFALQQWLMPRFDGIMVVSRAIAEDFLPGRRVCLIEGGILPELFAAAPVTDGERRDNGRFRIVLAGTLELYNGLELALEAMNHLPADYQLMVAGNGSLAGRLQQAAARDARISYLGFLDFADLVATYRSADLLLNLRLTRAMDTRYFFPSKLMELLASGTPVLSTGTGHVEDVYGHVLYLLEEETPQALAAHIRAIAASPPAERRALGRRAREFIFSEKTWDRQGAKLADYIRSEVFASG
jgi:glycosyltransferase involved in cell wall biosynthesis